MLGRCLNTIVGDAMTKGISGNENMNYLLEIFNIYLTQEEKERDVA